MTETYCQICRIIIFCWIVVACAHASLQSIQTATSAKGTYRLFWNRKRAQSLNDMIIPYITSTGKSNTNGATIIDSSMKAVVNLEETMPMVDSSIKGMTISEITSILKKSFGKALFSARYIPEGKYQIFMTANGILMIGIKQFLGWKVYTMTSNMRILTEENANRVTYSIEYRTPDLHEKDSKSDGKAVKLIRQKNACVLKFSIVYDKKKNKTTCKVATLLHGGSKGNYKSIVNYIFSNVFKQIQYEGLLACVRREQAEEVKKLSKSADRQKKLKDVDKLLNPEKYKSSSPTVRKLGSGTGRFTPSAATQARRTVSRGG